MPQSSTVDEKQISDAKSKAGAGALLAATAFREIAGTRAGRKFLWDFLSRCEMYVVPPLDPLVMAFHAGKRSLGLDIMTMFDRHAPGAYALMQKESTETPKVEDERSDDTIN